MNNLKKKKAFTLIEIILVLIILGVLAAMAFPGIFAQIERHRAQEALNTMNMIRSAIESCGVENNYDFSKCITWDEINMDDPSKNAGHSGSYFDYNNAGGPNKLAVCSNAFTTNTYSITATRIPEQSDCTGTNLIIMNRNSDGSSTCTGYGKYAGFC